MKSLSVSKNLSNDIHNMCQHLIDNTDKSLSQDYEELRDMTLNNDRFKTTIIIEERIPECKDLIVNILIKHILDLVDNDEDDTEEMNAFYKYITYRYARPGYFDDNDFLLRATTIEALEYVIHWLIGDES